MKEITTFELEHKLNSGEKVEIIDVREPVEVATGKIPGAKNIPLGEIPERLQEFDKNKHYYIICLSGGRSKNACAYLTNHGYDVTNVSGGMSAWQGDIE